MTLTKADIADLNTIDPNASYDGDGDMLKLALDAYSLGIAHEFDPYFGLSISRVDPLPHQLEAVYEYFWVIQDVDYLETVVRRERRGSSQGLSVRVARGLYYRPSAFRSRPMEWEETVHAGTGMLGLTTKHIYFAGSRKRFRVRYDRIVAFEPFSDGFGIMRDAQTARPQTFRTGDGWFAYNLGEKCICGLQAQLGTHKPKPIFPKINTLSTRAPIIESQGGRVGPPS